MYEPSQSNATGESSAKDEGEIAEAQGPTPDDYRTLPILPTQEEFLTRKQTHVPKNIVEGSYRNLHHYLDTHFRLLREDFLAPLREAIATYKQSLSKTPPAQNPNKPVPIRVYPEARFVPYDPTTNFGNAIRHKTYPMVNPGPGAQNSKFMFGSLVCFSADDFESFFFGTIVKLRYTPTFCFNVRLWEGIPFMYHQTYTMLECISYFDPYYFVLTVLQNFDTTRFPLEKYLVQVVNKPEPLGYLTHVGTWSSKEALDLNDKQHQAYKSALSSKLAVIQGPPGTGKTYIGLKIVQTLIQNHTNQRWRRRNTARDTFSGPGLSTPVLVVALTNHGLDQFLEGLLPYTSQIVRIGQQSTNINVSKFNFRSFGDRYEQSVYYSTIEEELENKETLLEELECVLSYGGLFHVKNLADANPELQNSPILHLEDKELETWLMGESSTEEQREERWETIKELDDFLAPATTTPPLNPNHEDKHLLTISHLQRTADELGHELESQNAMDSPTTFQDGDFKQSEHRRIQDDADYLKWRLEHAKLHIRQASQRILPEDFADLHPNDRWILYFRWLDSHAKHLKTKLVKIISSINDMWRELEDSKHREDGSCISQAVVVGMTTSGAARHRTIVETLRSQVVIVEEAAEVLESHVVASLTRHCQHLILIGDHQQLQPITCDYKINSEHQLGISLFERMVRNGIRYNTLEVQHRMRPEIARLISPSIYPSLKNHISVCQMPDVPGFKHNLFFVTHSKPEETVGSSRKNLHEARYLIALTRHLILQGIQPGEITILATYLGQMQQIRNEQRKSAFPLEGVRVDVVDNFQGEENQLILLSLVRSNHAGCIGFVGKENRVCVALSRAKMGLYMVGDMETLAKGSLIWRSLKEVLESHGQLGLGLELRCQLHPSNVVEVVEPQDFGRVPDGGCHLPCGAELICGHVCGRKCHITDQNHIDYRCMGACLRLCPMNHRCPKRCSETCDPCLEQVEKPLPCGHRLTLPCSTQIEQFLCATMVTTMLHCNHVVMKPCYYDVNQILCPAPVGVLNPTCGHIINKLCHQSIEDNLTCLINVTIDLKCGHQIQAPCWQTNVDYNFDINNHKCEEKCAKLKIGCQDHHWCERACFEQCERCEVSVQKVLPCGHEVMVPCYGSDRLSACLCTHKVVKSCPSCGHQVVRNCSDNDEGKVCRRCSQKKLEKQTNE